VTANAQAPDRFGEFATNHHERAIVTALICSADRPQQSAPHS
jgi:hypothetical protein